MSLPQLQLQAQTREPGRQPHGFAKTLAIQLRYHKLLSCIFKTQNHEAMEDCRNHHQSSQAHSCSPSSFRTQKRTRCDGVHWKRLSGFYIENTHICTWVCRQFLWLNCKVLGLRELTVGFGAWRGGRKRAESGGACFKEVWEQVGFCLLEMDRAVDPNF